jgi:hypothetical protein
MPIRCVDGQIPDAELSRWEVPPLDERVALRCEQVRAVFEGSTLARGIALSELTRAQFDKLFAQRSRRKNACTLRRWAQRIRGARARAALLHASWEQVRAAAAHEEEQAQIDAAVAYALGVGPRRRRRSGGARVGLEG